MVRPNGYTASHARALSGEHLLPSGGQIERQIERLIQFGPHLGVRAAQGDELPIFVVLDDRVVMSSLNSRFHLLSVVVDSLPAAVGFLG